MKANRAALLSLFLFASQALAHPGHGAPEPFHAHLGEVALAALVLLGVAAVFFFLRKRLKK